jgi:hypothetical protein
MKSKILILVLAICSLTSFSQQQGTFKDPRDGKIYKTVIIGKQTWFSENLAYKAEKGCWAYDNNQNNVAKYGYLYDWNTAMRLCPTGWHLPSDAEWSTLWENSSINAGFEPILGGGYGAAIGFVYIEIIGYWWSSTENNIGEVSYWLRIKDYRSVDRRSGGKESGNSVRCIKDN